MASTEIRLVGKFYVNTVQQKRCEIFAKLLLLISSIFNSCPIFGYVLMLMVGIWQRTPCACVCVVHESV